MARKETYKDDSLPLAAVWVAIPPSLFPSSTYGTLVLLLSSL